MASFPEPPRNQISYADDSRDQEPQALREDHHDHDLAFARAKYAVLQPKKEERVTLPRWMVLSLFLLFIMFVLSFAASMFERIGR